MNEALVEQLQGLGSRGVLMQMAKAGQLLELACEMPQCLCPKGRRHFTPTAVPRGDWNVSPDHYPILKNAGGTLTPDNVRLSHTLCNRRDYGWRMKIKGMLAKGLSLQEIATALNDGKVARPHGTSAWTAANVRKAYVS